MRIGPYVRDVVPDEDLPRGVLPLAGTLPASARTLWGGAAGTCSSAYSEAERCFGSGSPQAGVAMEPATFRGRQLGWALAGIGAGAVVLIVLA